MTQLCAELSRTVTEHQRCVAETAAQHGANWPVVHAAFVGQVQVPLAASLPP